MSVRVVVGTQWGDEREGRIVDLPTETVDIVARYRGNTDAGHTVVTTCKICLPHLLASHTLHSHGFCVIGDAVVLDTFDRTEPYIGEHCGTEHLRSFPTALKTLEVVVPRYGAFEGCKSPASTINSIPALPRQTRKYVQSMSSSTGIQQSS